MNIIVVDLEEDARKTLEVLAQAPGNEVQSARTGDEALELAQGKQVDLLITEVILEPMNGFTLRNKMENRHPEVRTIFLSAYDLAPYAEHTAGYEVVSKPASVQKLFPAIARVMGVGKTLAPAAPAPHPAPPPAREPEPESQAQAEPEAAPAQTPPPVAEAAPVPSVTAAPAAVPRVMATPSAATVESPSVTAIPAATPVAMPRVAAAAVAVPRLSATPGEQSPVPAAAPAAVPKVAAMPAATSPAGAPVAVPRVAASPVAVPASVPRATATPAAQPQTRAAEPQARAAMPVAVPKVTATPAATPVAVPKATAAPVAIPKPIGTPAAAPRGMAAPAAAVPKATAVPSVRPPVATDPLLGKTLGSYRIERRLGKGKWGPVYLAIQTSMNRPVAMELLAADVAADEAARQNFVATARAKATVQHPHILSVYEADQAEGHYFYTHEYVDGFTLAQLAARGEGLSEPMALQTIKCVAQGLSHLHHHHIAHSIPDATDIYVGKDGLPYLSNVALPSEELPAMQEEICTLGRIVRGVLPGGQAQDRGLEAMLTRMAITNQLGFQSWPPLFQAIQAIEPKVVPADAFKLSAQDQAAIRAVEAARKRQKRVVIGSIAGFVALLVLLAGVIWYEFLRPATHDHSNEMVKIDAGQFIYQDGQKTLPTFYIEKYEVTMAEYEKFLEFLKAHGNPTDYDSPLQPAGRTHVPRDWEIYYGRAGSSLPGYRTVRGVPITLDCPVFNVDYFDAYAYAKWEGHRLPTEQEWEKAARGPAGNLYPWGNDWDPAKLNAGGDYQSEPGPGYKPGVDGYTCWAPVDALMTDRSPYGVIGMAGNVSEWTDSWDASKTYVMIRGGNYKSTSEQALATSSLKVFPQQIAETLGFRTVSDAPAGK